MNKIFGMNFQGKYSSFIGLGLFVGSFSLQRMLMTNFRGLRMIKSSSCALFSSKAEKSSSERKKSSIYTRTGDSGTSSLYNGERRSKTDLTFEALGNSDELNAAIGLAREYCADANNGIDTMLEEIQSRLFDLGSAVATPQDNSSSEKKAYTAFPSSCTSQVEAWIDELDSQLPPIKNFVIPSGGLSSVHLNLARTICRRAERSVIPLVEDKHVDAEVAKYLNRLSDFLFVAGRAAVAREGKKEILWRKGKV